MKSGLDALASRTGMSQAFRLRGVDICRVLECRPFNSQAPAESCPKTDPLPELEAFSARLASCGDLDSLVDTGLNALSTIFAMDHSFVMALDEDGTRLYTLASHGDAESGEGREFLHFPGSGKSRRGVRQLTHLAVRRSPDPAIRHRPDLVTDGLRDGTIRLLTDHAVRLLTDTSALVPTR